jgi:hypothetical protein
MDPADQTSRQQLITAIVGKPDTWAQIIAVRSALRAVPNLVNAYDKWLADYALVTFRTLLVSWAACRYQRLDLRNAARFAAGQAANAANVIFHHSTDSDDDMSVHGHAVRTKARSAAAAAESAAYAGHSISKTMLVDTAADASTISAAYADDPRIIWNQVDLDCQNLSSGRDWTTSSVFLSTMPIWFQQVPEKWAFDWRELRAVLSRINPDFDVWTDWSERRFAGQATAFEIPGDSARIEDTAILRKLAEQTDEDFWGKGHEYVNATLKGWLDEARERVRPTEPEVHDASFSIVTGSSMEVTAERVAAALEAQASPQAQIVDGKLDAIPNTVFDKPQYSDNLANLPSELMAYAQTILDSLPSNCPAIVRTCFASFHGELLVRGNRPILNILKGMAASIQAELYAELDNDSSPDEWPLRDPREWGPGMGAMFAHFFKGYHDLIHHFPLDSEREALIADTPIDEVAASGSALTAPVDAVAELILDLAKQGFATDNIVRIVEAHALYNRDIAQLPTPNQPTDVITPKRRHVLMTTGFYHNLYNLLGSTASLWPFAKDAFLAALPKLKDAIDALMKFIP